MKENREFAREIRESDSMGFFSRGGSGSKDRLGSLSPSRPPPHSFKPLSTETLTLAPQQSPYVSLICKSPQPQHFKCFLLQKENTLLPPHQHTQLTPITRVDTTTVQDGQRPRSQVEERS